jgi:hypothetical protein
MGRRTKTGECAYCGKTIEITRDHVIPQCLFLKPRPKPIVVWACESCNNEKSKTDDYLRDFLVSDAFASESSAVQGLRGKLLSSVRQNSSAFAKTLLRDARPHSFFTPGGIYLGEVFSVSVDMGTIFARIISGLYFKVYAARIPASYDFQVQRLDPLRGPEGIAALINMPFYARFRVGQDFSARLMVSDQDPFTTMWLLCFYRSIWIYAETSPQV